MAVRFLENNDEPVSSGKLLQTCNHLERWFQLFGDPRLSRDMFKGKYLCEIMFYIFESKTHGSCLESNTCFLVIVYLLIHKIVRPLSVLCLYFLILNSLPTYIRWITVLQKCFRKDAFAFLWSRNGPNFKYVDKFYYHKNNDLYLLTYINPFVARTFSFYLSYICIITKSNVI